MADVPSLLVRRAERYAVDLRTMAVPAPQRPASDGVLMVYSALRETLGEHLSDAEMGLLPRFGAGARPTLGELCIYAGQLAVVAGGE